VGENTSPAVCMACECQQPAVNDSLPFAESPPPHPPPPPHPSPLVPSISTPAVPPPPPRTVNSPAPLSSAQLRSAQLTRSLAVHTHLDRSQCRKHILTDASVERYSIGWCKTRHTYVRTLHQRPRRLSIHCWTLRRARGVGLCMCLCLCLYLYLYLSVSASSATVSGVDQTHSPSSPRA
jgi:hypothetical protein